MRRIDIIVIHCTATPNGHPVSVADVDRWHKERGFTGIGYHYLIDTDGSVSVGRDEDEIGAHAKDYNSHSIGVCLVGGVGGKSKYNPGEYTPAQWDSLRIAVDDLTDRYKEAMVIGHRDLSPDLNRNGSIEPSEWIKLCPAFDVNAWMQTKQPASENIFHRISHHV